MTPRTATRYFCTDSETARKIFAEERNYADSLVPFMESHARLCGDWLPALYGFDEPDVGLWDDKYGNMKLPKDIFHVDYSQYHKGEKNATKEES